MLESRGKYRGHGKIRDFNQKKKKKKKKKKKMREYRCYFILKSLMEFLLAIL
jgi:hypothetical protein